MNGAITDPCDSTTKPPKTAIMTMIGNSQNFLRTRMKAQSSRTKDMGRRIKIGASLFQAPVRVAHGRSNSSSPLDHASAGAGLYQERALPARSAPRSQRTEAPSRSD